MKYIEWRKESQKELYDLNKDPYELESRHHTVDNAQRESLREYLHALEDCTGESCQTAEDGPQPK